MRDDYGLISHLMSFVRNMVPFSITLDSSNIVSKKYEQRVIPNELIIKVLMESGNQGWGMEKKLIHSNSSYFY